MLLCRRDDLEISTLLGKSSHGSVEASPARLRARRVRGGLVGDAARAGGGAARAECDRGRREARSRAVRMEEKKSFLPFFLDVNTKGGIVFYSIVGIVAPFWAGQMIDSWGFDVVTAGNVILIGYVGAGIAGWTSTCAARRARCGPRPPPLCRC